MDAHEVTSESVKETVDNGRIRIPAIGFVAILVPYLLVALALAGKL